MQNTTVKSRADAKIFHPHSTEASSEQTASRRSASEATDEDPGATDNIIKTLASRITDSLVADLSNEGTDEDEVVA
ncbi:hypothetical protein H4Q26_011852 [Puccinia striiformis f. sp. tritici PST-130]|nr:hypothetical protein H4Q26_011852 [Puccinia striiformis f. sp. tritici PST-130]